MTTMYKLDCIEEVDSRDIKKRNLSLRGGFVCLNRR